MSGDDEFKPCPRCGQQTLGHGSKGLCAQCMQTSATVELVPPGAEFAQAVVSHVDRWSRRRDQLVGLAITGTAQLSAHYGWSPSSASHLAGRALEIANAVIEAERGEAEAMQMEEDERDRLRLLEDGVLATFTVTADGSGLLVNQPLEPAFVELVKDSIKARGDK